MNSWGPWSLWFKNQNQNKTKNNLLSHPYHLVPWANNSDDDDDDGGDSDGGGDDDDGGGDDHNGDGDDGGDDGGDGEMPVTFLKTLHI